MQVSRMSPVMWKGLLGAGVVSFLTVGCGATVTKRMVDDPSGESVEYGGPKDTTYSIEVDTALSQAQFTVFQASKCEVIPVTVMQRYEETLHGDEVVQRTPVTKKQVAGDPTGVISCDQTFARNAEVFLGVGEAHYSVGVADAMGRVRGNLAQVLKVGSMEELPASVQVLVRPYRAAAMVALTTLTLSELKRREGRVNELLGELELILGKGSGASPAELTRSYEVYSQLHEIAPGDPRVEGISSRFWEVYYGRKQDQAVQQLSKNLQALGAAKDTLKIMGDAAIPLYVQVAVNSGTLDQRALEWSTLRLISALRGAPDICRAGFAWGQLAAYGWPVDVQLAAQFVRYGRGDGYASLLQSACAR
jgi:hypothetical protein